MSTSVTMPALGESVTEGTVTRWLKQEGDEVAADEPLLEVSTDKVDTEIPSPAAGVLQRIVVGEDETVAVGAELAVIGDGQADGGEQQGQQDGQQQQQQRSNSSRPSRSSRSRTRASSSKKGNSNSPSSQTSSRTSSRISSSSSRERRSRPRSRPNSRSSRISSRHPPTTTSPVAPAARVALVGAAAAPR